MALFPKKKTGDAPAAASTPDAAPADVSGDTSTVVDDFSDFSADAVQAASTPANGAANGKAKRVKTPKPDKPAAPRGPKGVLKNGAFIGLNIGGDSIKVIEAGAKNGVLAVSGMGMVPTPADSISNGVVMSVNALAGAIREAMNQAGIKSKKVITSVSGTGALVVRIIEVPKMSDGELEDNMKMDADRYIPFPPSEVIMDFKALRDLPSDPDAMNMEVLLAAAQREIIDLHIQVLQDAKLDPRAIDVEPLAAARSLTHPLTTGGDLNAEPDYNDVAAILNIGASGTEISILRGDILVFTRSVPSGGNALTQAISDTLGLAWHDAEGLKRDMGDALAPNESATATANATNFGATSGANGSGDDWTEFDMNDAAAGDAATSNASNAPSFTADDASTPATDAMMETSAVAGAPTSTDPFDDAFFHQGPQADSGQITLGDELLQAEPGEQQQQKESDDDEATEAKDLPTREGEVVSTEAIAGARAADAVESSVLPTKDAGAENVSTPTPEITASPVADITPTTSQSAPADVESMQAQNAQTAAGMPVELRALFNFEEVEDPDEELPTAEDGKPLDINSLLGDEEDDLSDLPTLVSDAPASAPMASAFDFPVATGGASTAGASGVLGATGDTDEALPTRAGGAASTESVSGSDAIDAGEASLLPTVVAGATAASATNPFAFQNDPFAASASGTTTAAETLAPVDFNLGSEPAAVSNSASASAPAEDPFAAFDLSGAAPGTASPATSVSATSAADDFDLDSLFGGSPSTPASTLASTSSAPVEVGSAPTSDAGMNALDILGDNVLGDDILGDAGAGDFGATDFGADFSSFGAGLGGASAGEIDAQTLHGIVGPALDTLIAEVRRSLEYHTTRHPDAAVRRITLIGGGAKLKNIDAYFTQSLGIPTSVGNPLSRLPINAPKLPPGYADENGPLFAVALGLAMRELMK